MTIPAGLPIIIRRSIHAALAVTLFVSIYCEPAMASKGEVFVLGTLYKRHETTPVYDLATLRRIITAINPDVLVLDVNPTELREQKVFPGKIEYTAVIFPYLNERRLRAYAGEPAEPMFSEIVGKVNNLRKELERNNPEGMAAMKQFRNDSFAALSRIWKTPADVNSQATERIIIGLKTYEEEILGHIEELSNRRWNNHGAQITLQAMKENPGKRILQITGIENCPQIRRVLRHNRSIKLIDMETWLRKNLKA